MPRHGAEATFRDSVLNLRTEELEDCFLSVFHVSDSYALLNGEAIPGEHTANNAALRAYLSNRLATGSGLAFDVKIDQGAEGVRAYS